MIYIAGNDIENQSIIHIQDWFDYLKIEYKKIKTKILIVPKSNKSVMSLNGLIIK